MHKGIVYASEILDEASRQGYFTKPGAANKFVRHSARYSVLPETLVQKYLKLGIVNLNLDHHTVEKDRYELNCSENAFEWVSAFHRYRRGLITHYLVEQKTIPDWLAYPWPCFVVGGLFHDTPDPDLNHDRPAIFVYSEELDKNIFLLAESQVIFQATSYVRRGNPAAGDTFDEGGFCP